MLMLIMENWSLGLLSASFLVISLVLKVLNCGILKPRRLLLAEMLSLMKLLCYMMFHLLMFLLRVNIRLLFSILLFRWSMLLIQVIHLVMKMLMHMMNPSLMMNMSLLLQISLLFHSVGISHVTELGGVLINLTGSIKR